MKWSENELRLTVKKSRYIIHKCDRTKVIVQSFGRLGGTHLLASTGAAEYLAGR
jgi:hypothetical protein